MKRFMIGLATVSFFLIFCSGNLFAAKRVDWGWSPDQFKYETISGEVTSVNLDLGTLRLSGMDGHVYFNDKTMFYVGDISTEIDRVYGGSEFSEKDMIMPKDIKSGKLMKCRFNRGEEGKYYLDTCLIEE